MKFKISNISIKIATLSLFFVGQCIYAQELSPVAKLAQDYILRLNEDLNATNNLRSSTEGAVVVNPEGVERDAIAESIDTISKAVEDLTKIQDQAVSDIKETVKENIDTSIIDIRKTTEKPAFELQQAVDQERTELFETITQSIEDIEPTQTLESSQKLDVLREKIENSLNTIQQDLETESGLPVTFEKSKRDITKTLLKFQQTLNEKRELIESRQGELVFTDSDQDGVSDYDEIYIYKTNPSKSRTIGDQKTDGEKIQEGINPLSDIEQKISYQDPREDKESFVSENYKVQKIELIKDEKKLIFEGNALPNTYITLYIYSTPIIVTVKTDQNGQWSYILEQEIENGEHQIYVATVESSGKIIARSNPILFTKSAEAATIGIAGSIETSRSTQGFLKDNFILITLATLIGIVILAMMFIGNHKTIKSAITELKDQVNSK